ncbi:MAG: Endonuclease III [Alphaproteobacteria bacterium ADurb.Bin438]|nr:MAG: Endonuclease III [Alphaproteobacteria bacterium ADurb.Bin438]
MNEYINEIFLKLLENNPNPVCELDYVNDYTFLVAIVLSAQTTDKGVNKATQSLFQKVDNPYDMIALGEEGLKHYIKSIGLYNNKAKFIMNLSKDLIEKHNGKVPVDFEKLNKLQGVGRKTAKVFLNSAYDFPLIAVDTHVFRVSNRLKIAEGKNVETVEKNLEKNVPSKYKTKAGHLLVLHGRYVCLAKKPKCEECVLKGICPSLNDFV